MMPWRAGAKYDGFSDPHGSMALEAYIPGSATGRLGLAGDQQEIFTSLEA